MRIAAPHLHLIGWGGVVLWLAAVAAVATGLLGDLGARRAAIHVPDDPSPAYLARAREIQALLEHIPPAKMRESLVADLLRTAETNGLEVSGGRYREEAFEGGTLGRIETTLPVSGERMALLRWVYGLSSVLPAAALTRVSLNRSDLNEPFSGDIRLDLLLRSAP